MIVTGHTADDQAETVWMRQARAGETPALGLAGMAPATLRDGAVWIVRPLLGIRRAALREHLRDLDIGWIDDPTNADRRFERPRLRQGSGGQIATEGGETLVLAERAARAREDVNRRAAGLLRAFASMPAPGLVRLDPAFARDDDRAAALHALRILLAVVGGATFLPNKEAATAVLARLTAGKARATLSRCVVDARRAGIFLHRERRGLPPPCPAEAGMVWDGRRRITFGNSDSLIIEPRGPAGEQPGTAAALPRSLVGAARAAEPALRPAKPGAGLIDAAALHCLEPVMAPWRLFLPSFDLVVARAVADLVGAPAIPRPPFLDSADHGASAIA
jgi:tRNA(Ile)-lysidine synthase